MSNDKQGGKPDVPKTTTRRKFLAGATAGGALAAMGPLVGFATPAEARDGLPSPKGGSLARARRRARKAYDVRNEAAQSYLTGGSGSLNRNGDEARYDDLRAQFFKTLPQNEFGEVDVDAYEQLRKALASGSYDDLEAVPLSTESDRALANPLASWAFELIGPDSWSLRMPPAPRFDSNVIAAEMGEVYWQAITRDVPFREYGSNGDIAAAVSDMNAFSHALVGQDFTVDNLFRGETAGDLVGPYLSQFLWQPFRWGLAELEQLYRCPVAGSDFCDNVPEWLSIQRGAAPAVPTPFEATGRYLANGRDLAEYVHGDVVYQAYLTAALVALGWGPDAIDEENPYLDAQTQGGFITFGPPEIVDLVAKVAHAALKAAWFQKWLVHRRLRPEVYAARAHFADTGERDYDVNAEILECAAADRLRSDNGNLLLPLSFPEGSPTHPAYPAGHATVAGACATVLKALFNEDFVIPSPVEASADGSTLDPWTGTDLTLGGEVDKLASNVTLGRDTAGVHYRSDGIDGLVLGEEVAIGILTDYAATRIEPFAGFSLTKFDGDQIFVSGNGAEPKANRPGRARGKRRRIWREHF